MLDGNKLGDGHVTVLAEALMITSYKPLKLLSLGENQIGDAGVEAVAEMLDVNSTGLKELRLLWNNITGKGGNKLADSLKSNTQLRVLDLSWNALGSCCSPGEVGTQWGHALAENKTLQHLDLSFCQLRPVDSMNLAGLLKQNHSIYGIHMQGNEGCRVDSLGFIRVEGGETSVNANAALSNQSKPHQQFNHASPRDQILTSRIDGTQT